MSVSRRELLLGSGAFAALQVISGVSAETADGIFEVPSLPYAYNALEPVIDEVTMHVHHDKHFVAYATKMKAALGKLGGKPVVTDEDLTVLLGKLDRVSDIGLRVALRNNGGGYLNHKQFFAGMQAPSKVAPVGSAINAVIAEYGSLEKFQEEFSAKAVGLFGSGFVWLVKNINGKLEIRSYANQDHPAMDADGATPLLACDCWEHAYYLKYQNRRPDYVKAWWSVVNWDDVSSRYGGN